LLFGAEKPPIVDHIPFLTPVTEKDRCLGNYTCLAIPQLQGEQLSIEQLVAAYVGGSVDAGGGIGKGTKDHGKGKDRTQDKGFVSCHFELLCTWLIFHL
jgi:hypothetical protein